MAAGGGPPDDLGGVAEFTDAIACRRLHAARVHNTDRILTTHVGSLVRPPEFRSPPAGAGRDGGPFDQAELERAAAPARWATSCAQQAEVGIDIVSDGEFGKTISWSRVHPRTADGFEDRPDPT